MHSDYPSRVITNSYGQALVADRDLPADTCVAKFEGPLVPEAEVPPDEVCHALWLSDDAWLIPHSSARFANHSCQPNCRVNDDLEMFTLRPVSAGAELTFSYNTVYPGEIPPPWDDRWSFQCQCGAANCQGRVGGWVFQSPAAM